MTASPETTQPSSLEQQLETERTAIREGLTAYLDVLDQYASEKAYCLDCMTELPDPIPCVKTEDGQHIPDLQLHQPPAERPHRSIRVEFVLRVPNDGYRYTSDAAARLEQIMSLVLLHPMVSAVASSGPTGSSYLDETSHDWSTGKARPR